MSDKIRIKKIGFGASGEVYLVRVLHCLGADVSKMLDNITFEVHLVSINPHESTSPARSYATRDPAHLSLKMTY